MLQQSQHQQAYQGTKVKEEQTQQQQTNNKNKQQVVGLQRQNLEQANQVTPLANGQVQQYSQKQVNFSESQLDCLKAQLKSLKIIKKTGYLSQEQLQSIKPQILVKNKVQNSQNISDNNQTQKQSLSSLQKQNGRAINSQSNQTINLQAPSNSNSLSIHKEQIQNNIQVPTQSTQLQDSRIQESQNIKGGMFRQPSDINNSQLQSNLKSQRTQGTLHKVNGNIQNKTAVKLQRGTTEKQNIQQVHNQLQQTQKYQQFIDNQNGLKNLKTDFKFLGKGGSLCTLGKQQQSIHKSFLSKGISLKYSALAMAKEQYFCWMKTTSGNIQQQLYEEIEKDSLRPGFSESAEQIKRGDMVLQQKKLNLLVRQQILRSRVEQEQEEINHMQEKNYKRFVREQAKNRYDMALSHKKRLQDQQNKLMFEMKKTKSHFTIQFNAKKDMRQARNKAVIRLHDKFARELTKQKDDDRARRLEALKARDFDAYQQMLRETRGPQTGDDKYQEIEKFLHGTEEYLNKLSYKVSNVKIAQVASEAAQKELQEARRLGYSEDDANELAKAVAQEKLVQATTDEGRIQYNLVGESQNKYYSQAHAVEERITKQPSLLKHPNNYSLRDYQIVGLQWMVSLYNNHLNGILADEMGLGKTLQVMALLSYLMERKGNYGPHLIIVPNAVIVNWRSELTRWLPDVKCIFYVGEKGARHRQFQQEVYQLQFNILVTTYEYTMKDRSRLQRIQWQYIVIDEAQRLKNHNSRLARDLTRFSCSRRLLLTGTPLQNDLHELWSLLNLLLPEVFDDKSSFASWFEEDQNNVDDWMAKEKRIVVVNRLHQILEPFMLRRQVQDVEKKLPTKSTITIKIPITPFQGLIYNWIKETGTKRVDPLDPKAQKKGSFESIQNKIVELRKLCNHPQLVHPPYEFDHETVESLISESGKLCTLDRVLVKLYQTGHKVLLFSTMTKLLDVIEIYFRNRVLPDGKSIIYRRIDGNTSLEDREDYISQFNNEDQQIFVFLLSIRAAGRGLNLQAADTVIIYDPDANPKNEEQAIARSHRIGQTREVKVMHLESVVDPYRLNYRKQQNDSQENKKYVDSVESLIRNTIQQEKIAIANEVIDAGGFDMMTSNDQRRANLEALLQDEERFKVGQNEVLSNHELNKQLARSDEELQIFDRLDNEIKWPGNPQTVDDSPSWIKYDYMDLQKAYKYNLKNKFRSIQHSQARLKEMEDEIGAEAMDLVDGVREDDEGSEEENDGVSDEERGRKKSRRRKTLNPQYQEYFDGENLDKDDKEEDWQVSDMDEGDRNEEDDKDFKTTATARVDGPKQVIKQEAKVKKLKKKRPVSKETEEFMKFYHENKDKDITDIKLDNKSQNQEIENKVKEEGELQDNGGIEREDGEEQGDMGFETPELQQKYKKTGKSSKKISHNPINNLKKFNLMRKMQKEQQDLEKKKQKEEQRIMEEQRKKEDADKKASEKRQREAERLQKVQKSKEQLQFEQQKELEKLYSNIERKRKQTEREKPKKLQIKKQRVEEQEDQEGETLFQKQKQIKISLREKYTQQKAQKAAEKTQKLLENDANVDYEQNSEEEGEIRNEEKPYVKKEEAQQNYDLSIDNTANQYINNNAYNSWQQQNVELDDLDNELLQLGTGINYNQYSNIYGNNNGNQNQYVPFASQNYFGGAPQPSTNNASGEKLKLKLKMKPSDKAQNNNQQYIPNQSTNLNLTQQQPSYRQPNYFNTDQYNNNFDYGQQNYSGNYFQGNQQMDFQNYNYKTTYQQQNNTVQDGQQGAKKSGLKIKLKLNSNK